MIAPHELTRIGRYKVVRLIAEGGMAWVFEVVDPSLDVHRALKMLKPGLSDAEVDLSRFQSEARLLAQLDHPNLITPFEFDRDAETGCFFYTMTLAVGGSLWERGRLGAEEAGPLFLDVLAALSAVHGAGIVHRDVKPSNIFHAADGRALLGDLGIARDTRSKSGLTKTGTTVGTTAYMSPEQAYGRPVGPPSDVFSVGLTLYQALTGASVYERIEGVETDSGEQVLMYLGSLLYGRREIPIHFDADVPPPLRRVIRTACRFAPEDRYADALAMRGALAEALEARPRRLAPPTLPRAAREAPRRGAGAVAGAGRALGRGLARGAGAVAVAAAAAGRGLAGGARAAAAGVADAALGAGAAAGRALSRVPRPRIPRGRGAALAGGALALALLAAGGVRFGPELAERLAAEPAPSAPGAEARPVAAAPPALEPAPAEPSFGTAAKKGGAEALPEPYSELRRRVLDAERPEPERLDLVSERLAGDASPEATAVLVAAATRGSLLVSMASLRSLEERAEPALAPALAPLLRDEAWQRRAWTARVLGATGAEAALDALRAQRAREEDARVMRQIDSALAKLPEGAASESAERGG